MRRLIHLVGFLAVFFSTAVAAQRIVAECTVDYRVNPDSSWTDNGSAAFNGIKRVFIKGKYMRTD
ncbi:MAG: hypothetical protein ACK5B4_08340, partial [Bacteroidota bacterium]